jgi:hypothetical protein
MTVGSIARTHDGETMHFAGGRYEGTGTAPCGGGSESILQRPPTLSGCEALRYGKLCNLDESQMERPLFISGSGGIKTTHKEIDTGTPMGKTRGSPRLNFVGLLL